MKNVKLTCSAEWGTVAVMQLDHHNVFVKVCGRIIFLPILRIYYPQCIHQISCWKVKRQLLNGSDAASAFHEYTTISSEPQ